MATFGQRVGLAAKAVTGIFSDQMSETVARMMGGVLPGGYGLPPVRGTREFLKAYGSMPWLRAVGERIATAVAQTEWQLFVLKRGNERATKSATLIIDGRPLVMSVDSIHRASPVTRRKMLKAAADAGDLKQITDHPMLTAITGGNSFQTGLGMRKVTQLHLDIVGDAFWLKERDSRLSDSKNPNGTVVGLWPVPPDWIIATPTPATRYFRVSFRGWQGNIPDSEFVWFSMDDPSNPYGRGSGTAMALADELETDEYTSRHVKAFFYNRARPDLIIWPKEGNANEANVKRIEQQWLQASQGFFRAFKPFFMTRPVEVKELEMNFRSLELNKLRQFERDCYDDQTDALTRRGWVRGVELRDDDEVLGWSHLWQQFVYRKPRQLVKYRYDGEMHHWLNPRIDVCVTPNHRMLVKSPNENSSWGFRPSESCLKPSRLIWRIAGEARDASEGETRISIPNVTYGVSRTPGRHGAEIDAPYYEFDTVTFARWLGFFVAEGSSSSRVDEDGKPNRFCLEYSQTQESEEPEPVGTVSEMVHAATCLDVGAVKVNRKNRLTVAGRAAYVIGFSNRSVWHWIQDNVGSSAVEKHLPRCVFSWTRAAQKALLDALIAGDGHTNATGAVYSTASDKLADDVQELSLLLGFRARKVGPVIDNRSSGIYNVFLSHHETAWVKNSQCHTVAYSGDIWCVDIEGDAFVTRRNGKVAVHGNTVMQVFGLPPEILGVLESSNKATITAADYIMARYVVSPRLEFMRSVLQERLVPEYDDKLIVEFPNPVQEDEDQQQAAAVASPWALTVDEWRERSGHKPLEDEKIGSMHFVPSGGKLTTEDEILNPPEPPPMLAPGQPGQPGKPLKPKPGGESPGLAPGAPGSESPVEPKQIGKYRDDQPREPAGSSDGGQFGGGSDGPSEHDMATLDTEYLSTPTEAFQLLRDGSETTIAAEDLRGVLKRASKLDAKSTDPYDHPDLSNLTVEGTRVFHGGLNMPRDQMPQIPEDMQAKLFAELKEKGISVTRGNIAPLKLGPTQNQIDATKVGQMIAKYESGEKKDPLRPILVSSDLWCLDGHHRWATMAALTIENPSAKLKVPFFKIGLTHRKALTALLAFTKANNIPTLEHGKLYRLATVASLAGYAVGDTFTDPREVIAVTSLDALAKAKQAAGLNGSVVRVTIHARAWDFEPNGTALLAGLTYRVTRIGDGSVDVEVAS